MEPEGLLSSLTQKPWNGDEQDIRRIFEALQLPIPVKGEFMPGADHSYKFFINKYGVAINVERIQTDPQDRNFSYTRNDNNPLAATPIAEITKGNMRIVILPGVRIAKTHEQKKAVMEAALKAGMVYDDESITNTGLLPVRTQDFPDGVPFVLDRGCMKTREQVADLNAIGFSAPVTVDISQCHPDFAHAAAEMDRLVIKPLSQRFKEAWPDTSDVSTVKPFKMKAFWELCKQMKTQRNGKDPLLVDGWNGYQLTTGDELAMYCPKTHIVPEMAANYESRMNQLEGGLPGH